MNHDSIYLLGIKQSKAFDSPKRYPFDLAAVSDLSELIFSTSVTFLTGENGSGKSTIIETIANLMSLNAEGGSHHVRFQTRQTDSDLHLFMTPIRGYRRPKDTYFLRAESFYNLASAIESIATEEGAEFELRQYGGSLHAQSHGESFLSLIANRFGKSGFYLLDEPEAALSVKGQMQLLKHIDRLVYDKAQLIIATHSPIIMSYPGAVVYEFSDTGIERLAYQDTASFQLTKYFINNPDKVLHELGM